MPMTCRHCRRELNFSGDPPSFCGYCGLPLSSLEETASPHTALPPVEDRPPPAARADSMPASMGGYRLIRRLGAGGMGTVFEALDERTGHRFAVKVLAERLSESPSILERFRQEGRLASLVSHPRCVFIVAADEDNGRPYIVMELMPSFTLRDLIGGMERPLAAEEAVARILEVIEGLQEAHRLGVIHRDVKPSNCFLLEDGTAKIGDFGLSKSLVRDAELTQTGAYVGTVLYSSPEQLRNDPLDFRADIYSVAATLFFLLTARAPFPYESITEAVARISSEPPPDVRQFRPDVPRALARVVRKGLQRDREKRWQSLEEMRAALARLVPREPSAASLGLRLGAILIDEAILSLRLLLPLEWITHRNEYHALVVYGIHLVIGFAYFTVMDGLWGYTPGKRILRLQVARVERLEPPGLRRSALRTGVLVLALMVPQGVMWLPLDEGGLLVGQAIMLSLALVAVVWPMRRQNGFRGLHELLSGTRTVQLPWPEHIQAYRARAESAAVGPRPDEVPEMLGPYRIAGMLWQCGERLFLLGEDRSLERRVLIVVYPAGTTGAAPSRRDLARPARLRWLTSGTWNCREWDAFTAPRGCPLSELVTLDEPITWAAARPLIEQLAHELSAAENDGSLPTQLNLEQVWVQDDGRVQLLDAPLQARARPTSAVPLELLRQATVTLLEGRPLGAEARAGVRAPVPGHAAPMLCRLLGPDKTYKNTQQIVDDLAATRANPREVTFSLRLGHLWVLTILLLPGLVSMFATNDLAHLLSIVHQTEQLERMQEDSERTPNPHDRLEAAHRLAELRAERADHIDDLGRVGRFFLSKLIVPNDVSYSGQTKPGDLNRITIKQLAQRLGAARDEGPQLQMRIVGAALSSPVLFWPVAWTLWAFVFRGGISLRLMGIDLVRWDGLPAGPIRCACRALLVWTPIAALLILANSVILSANARLGLADALWWSAAGLLAVYSYVALIYPARSLHDVVAGTYLVPR